MWHWPTFPNRDSLDPDRAGHRERGIALIMAVVSVFLLTVAVLQTRAGVNLAEEIAVNTAQETQALYMARSGLAMVLEALAEDDPEVDSYQDDWAAANDVGAVPIADVGWATGRVSDEEGKFNVLDLVNDQGEADEYTDFTAERLVQMLLDLNIPDDRADEIVDSLIDWMDVDDAVTGAGGEDTYYMSLDKPYSCPNDLPAAIDELSLVKGIGPALLYQGEGDAPALIDFLTIYGNRTGKFRQVNLNTAPVEVLMSLVPDMDRELAEEITASRDAEPFKAANDIEDVPGFPFEYNHIIDLDIKLSQLIKVRSGHFSARVTGETARASSRAYGVFKRAGESVELVYYRGF